MTKTVWILIAVYLFLIMLCAILMVYSDSLSIAAREIILPIAADGFKYVLGAIVGTISAMLGLRRGIDS